MHKNKNLKLDLTFHKTGMRLLKIIHEMDSSAIPLSILSAVLTAGIPYINIFLSANIIDQLMQKQYEVAIVTAACMIGATMIAGTVLSVIDRQVRLHYRNLQLQFKILIRKKAMELDFETIENPEIGKKISFTERTVSMYGSIETVLSHYRKLLSHIITMFTAIGLVLAMCFSIPADGIGMIKAIATPKYSCILFGIAMITMIMVTQVCTRHFTKKQATIFGKHTETELRGSYLANIADDYKVGKVIRLYDMKEMLMTNIRKYAEQGNTLYASMRDVGRAQDMVEMSIKGVFTLISYFMVGVKILTHAITIGAFAKYAGALTQFGGAVNDIIWRNQYIQRNCMFMEKLLEFLDTPNHHETGTIPVEKRLDHEYEIEFHHVSFAYPGTKEMVLSDVNCKLMLKDKMAVVGKNGAGKTTFIKLLCRLYDPTEGYITLNGVDIRKYDEKEYMNLFSVVFQDFSLLSFTLGENIIVGDTVDEQRLSKCLRQSGADQVVAGFKDGLQTSLYKYQEDGVEISGGEAQKIAIARALYKDAPFVVLDEPTAALDPVSEYEVYQRFHEMTEDKTSIYISHRMSSCRFCDEILVFDQGRIVARGSHDELLQQNQLYANLWNAQAQYYA